MDQKNQLDLDAFGGFDAAAVNAVGVVDSAVIAVAVFAAAADVTVAVFAVACAAVVTGLRKIVDSARNFLDVGVGKYLPIGRQYSLLSVAALRLSAGQT